MTTLSNVYITRRQPETVEAIVKRLEGENIECFVAYMGRDTSVFVKTLDYERAYKISSAVMHQDHETL